jgi:hypothetical protein
MVCLRNISVDTLHKGDNEDNDNNNNNNNKETTENSHIGHCTLTSESVNVEIQWSQRRN